MFTKQNLGLCLGVILAVILMACAKAETDRRVGLANQQLDEIEDRLKAILDSNEKMILRVKEFNDRMEKQNNRP